MSYHHWCVVNNSKKNVQSTSLTFRSDLIEFEENIVSVLMSLFRNITAAAVIIYL